MTTQVERAYTQGTVLNNGVHMPWLGLGVWQTQDGDEVVNAVRYAVKAGYRLIDTAKAYNNEQGVGQGIRECGVPREELFITTKLWNADQGYESTLKAFEGSRKRLGLEYIDLYLIHWVKPATYRDTWKAMVKLYQDGRVRAIGVSNHQTYHIDTLIEDTGVVPAVNQVERHPLLTQYPLLDYCNQKGIRMQAYSPLMRGAMDHPVLDTLAKKYGKTSAQIILRWDVQNGVAVIPKSVREARIVENGDIFDFELSAEDMAAIDGMNRDHRLVGDPDHVTW